MNAKQDKGYPLMYQSSEEIKLPLCECQVQCIHREGEMLLCHRAFYHIIFGVKASAEALIRSKGRRICRQTNPVAIRPQLTGDVSTA